MFGRHNLPLSGLLGVNGEGQRFAIIQDGDVVLGSDTHGDLSVTQGIGGAIGLDLVDGLVELEGEGFGQGTSFLPGEDASQVFLGRERTVSIDITSGFFAEASIEILNKLRQEGVARLPTANVAKAHFFRQAVLEGLNDPLDPSFGLRRVGTNDLDLQLLHGSPKLGQGSARAGGGHIDPENAMFVTVEGQRLATASEILLRHLGIAEEALAFHEV